MVVVEFCPQTLKSHMMKAAAGILVFAAMVGVAHCGTGCKPASAPTAADEYTTRIIACAATAGYPGAYDHAADMRCRNQVNCEFGLPSCVKPTALNHCRVGQYVYVCDGGAD